MLEIFAFLPDCLRYSIGVSFHATSFYTIEKQGKLRKQNSQADIISSYIIPDMLWDESHHTNKNDFLVIEI